MLSSPGPELSMPGIALGDMEKLKKIVPSSTDFSKDVHYPKQISTCSHNCILEIESRESSPSTNAFHYFRIFFNLFYFIGFSPFKFKHNKQTNSYYLQQPTTFRKVIVLFLCSICFKYNKARVVLI